MRILVLHTRLSGYMAACWRALKRQTGCEFQIYCWPNQPDAPFDAEQFADLGAIYNRAEIATQTLHNRATSFRPDAVITSGWADKGYLLVCNGLRKRGIPVIAGCDAQWRGTLKQQLARYTAPLHIKRAIDVLWVTGERQATYGRYLGFHGNTLWDGYYACDWDRFEYGDQAAGPSSFNADEPYFLYVGRYVREKGIDTLAEAYRRYKNNVSAPWRLVCAGAGPLENTLSEVGAENLGFVQPEQLPYFMRNAAAFVLPSRYEPWGVVAQEAAASGLPLLLSDEVGAGVHLLRDGLNGFKHPPGDAKALGDCLSRLHQTKKEKISLMGQHSKSLSQQYTPEHWANTFASGLNILRNNSAVHESKS